MAVVGIEIMRRYPLANGASFGASGPYERITGIVRFAVDPDHPGNAGIADVQLAPRGEDGRVLCDADFEIMQPADPARGNGRLVFDVVNRGNKLLLRYMNHALQPPGVDEPEVGDGFLMRRGYTLAFCGWQHDIPSEPGRLGLRVPEALDGGQRVVGRVMCELEPAVPAAVLQLSDRGHRPYPARDVNEPGAALWVREYMGGPRTLIPRHLWRFARVEDGRVVPDPTQVYLAAGFEGGKYYDVVYTTEGAPVVGLGLLTARDFPSWLRRAGAAEGNPCAGSITHSLAFGSSQSGRFLRHFLSLGLNEDEDGGLVFDGVLPFVAGARRGEFNARFAQPSKLTVQMHGAMFPFSDLAQVDPGLDRTDGILSRLLARDRAPKVMYMSSATEYWGGAHGSLVHISVDGTRDLELPATSRVYLMAGTQHGPGVLPLQQVYLTGARGVYPVNSVDQRPLARAGLINLDRWVTEGVEPPPSRYPRLDDGTARRPDEVLSYFRTLPGGHTPQHIPQLRRLDYGPQADAGQLARLPPAPGEPYPIFISAVDEDGNEVAGIRQPDLTVPLGTYLGWNVHDPATGVAGEIVLLVGSTVPFSRTAEERSAAGDPRRSIAERYASKADYLDRVRAAAQALVAERYLLAGDVDEIVERSALRWDEFMKP